MVGVELLIFEKPKLKKKKKSELLRNDAKKTLSPLCWIPRLRHSHYWWGLLCNYSKVKIIANPLI